MNINFSSFLSPHCCNPSNSSVLRFRLAIGKPKCAASEIGNNEIALPGGLDPDLMPKHVAVIMDGNRRWARSRGLFTQEGHKAGLEALKLIAPIFKKCGVKVLSVFAFSTENWSRPISNDGRATLLGDRTRFPQSVQNIISSSEERCKGNKGSQFAMCVNYSGRYDIIQATRKIARRVQNGSLQVEDIDINVFEQHLETHVLEFPNPDLLIRTGGELRVSNYMMWQLANSELYFTKKMFPDIKEEDAVEGLAEFQRRKRNYLGFGQ